MELSKSAELALPVSSGFGLQLSMQRQMCCSLYFGFCTWKTVVHYKINSCLFKRSHSGHLLELSKFGSGRDKILQGNILRLLARVQPTNSAIAQGELTPFMHSKKLKS